MLAPIAASSFRCGACVITLERYLFSKITTTMWSGRGTADLSFVGAGGRTAACGVSVGSIPATRMRNTPASGVAVLPIPEWAALWPWSQLAPSAQLWKGRWRVPAPWSMTDLRRHRPPIRTAEFPQLPNRIVAKPALHLRNHLQTEALAEHHSTRGLDSRATRRAQGTELDHAMQ
jgi:hypothetical protein